MSELGDRIKKDAENIEMLTHPPSYLSGMVRQIALTFTARVLRMIADEPSVVKTEGDADTLRELADEVES